MKHLIIKIIAFYQCVLSFDRGLLRFFAPNGACRYPVSCSEFTKQAIYKYGIIKGTAAGIKRVISCNPLNKTWI